MRELRVLAAIGIVCGARGARAAALDQPPFSAKPAELLAAAAAAPTSDSGAIVLRDETTFTFDDAGRGERRYRVVFAIRKQSGVDGWGTLELEWRPFYQDKPTVRARVIAADGQVAELDPKLITDAPAISESPQVFSDRRNLDVPLPRLAIGSVVEEEYVIRDREPLLSAGIVETVGVGRGVAVQRTLITVSAPTGKAHIVTRGFAKAPSPKVSTAGKRTTWVYDNGPTPALTDREDSVPSDVDVVGWIGIATAPSWSVVAADYRKIVDKRLAEAPLSLPDHIKATSEAETLAHAVAWLHAHVRYTGIEFSDAAIVPWPPNEVVKRGFGDCKDKASLLVALLRAAGITADIALLDTGPGRDTDRELPGMGAFDHAIVRAKIDGKYVWVDATEDLLPAGQLPARDQGRLALVAATDTKDLVTTPMAAPADNAILEVRTFHLTEHDSGSVTEVARESGAFSDDLRRWYRDNTKDDLKKSLTKYVERVYRGKLAAFSADDSTDLTRPFSFTTEVHEVDRAFTKRQQIDVYLFPSDTLGHVPGTLNSDSTDERHHPFAWYRPHTYVIENRIELPPGYTMPMVQPHDQESVGTMTLTTDRRADGNTLVVTYRLDTGKVRLTAAEVVATRKAAHALAQRNGEHVVIAQSAWEQLHKGDSKAAITECQRLIALHPKEALHWGQLAEIYREVGMGAAARRAARKGVEAEPRASDAYAILAFQLRHDTLGRDFGFDMDRAGLIAAYRRALELDPRHIGALSDFSELLVRDANNQLTSDTRDIKEAIGLLRRAKEVSKEDKYDKQLASQLMLAGQYADAETLARSMPESRERSVLLVAIAAAARGSADAMTVLGAVASDHDRKTILGEAASALILLRRYDLARALFDQSKDATTNPLQAAMVSRLTAIDMTKLDPSDPRTPALQALTMIMGRPSPRTPPWDSEFEKELLGTVNGAQSSAVAKQFRALPGIVVDDMMAALSPATVDRDRGDGFRTTLDLGPSKVHFYGRVQGKVAKLIGASDTPDFMAPYVRVLLAKNDLDGARQWLKWAVEDSDRPGTSTAFHDVARLVHKQDAAGAMSKEVVDVASAMLLVSSQPKVSVPVLRQCTPTDSEIKKLCQGYLARALFELEQWPEVAEVERDRAAADPDNLGAVVARATALARSGHAQDAARVIEEALAKHADEVALLGARGDVAVIAGNWPDARAWFDKVLANPGVDVAFINNAAWYHLYFDASPDDARAIGNRGERMETKLRPIFANTLAAIEAEADRPFTSWKYLSKGLDSKDAKPRDADWYVIGRIAESYGLKPRDHLS